MNTVSCIIPAYNESERIGKVLEAINGHPLINEVIVIDDGSADVEQTQKIVEKFATVRFIRNEKNQGKSKTLYNGIQQAKGELLLLLDADLVGLTANDITLLIEPVTSGKVEMSISMRKNSPWIDRKLGIDFISGERVFHRSILDGRIDEIPKLSKFGFETFLNTIVMDKKCSLAVIFWPGVISPYKAVKRGLIGGIKGEIEMVLDIFKVVPFYTIPYMFYKMRSLIVKTD